MRRLVICSGKVNRHGYRNIPSGGRLESYFKNPVLLVEHNRLKASIGKVTDLRIDADGENKGMLTGVPEFDEQDDLAADYKRKYEKGYINACSIGHVPIVLSAEPKHLLPGQQRETVMEWELVEISMANIPSDRDAVGHELNLASDTDALDKLIPRLNFTQHKTEEMSKEANNLSVINDQLGIASDSTEADAVKAIETLQLSLKKAHEEKIDQLMTLGKSSGFITDDNEGAYRKLAASDYQSVSDLVSGHKPEKKEEKKEEMKTETLSVKDMIAQANKSNKATDKETDLDDASRYEKLSKENPKELLKIKKEDPEQYEKLAAAYGAKYATI